MTLNEHNIEAVLGSQELFEQYVREQLRQAVRVALIKVLEEEVETVIGAQRYECTEQRRDQRNGHYTRTLETTVDQIADLPVPRTRHGHQTQVFERSHRRRDDMDQAIGAMFVGGVSTKGVGNVMETLTGTHPSPSTVSRVFHSLESEYATWKTRTLAEKYAYAFADGTYFTVIYNGEGCKMPILAVVGITLTGEREVLGFSVGDRENQAAWEALFDDLKERGVKEIGLWVSDGNQTMLGAIASKFPSSSRQRCAIHKMENVLSYVLNKQREQIEPELKALFYQKNREAEDQAVAAFIEKYQKSYPTVIACLQWDLETCLTFYSFPKEHWKTIRTNNIIERLFGEVKRRSHKMASAFRTEDSYL